MTSLPWPLLLRVRQLIETTCHYDQGDPELTAVVTMFADMLARLSQSERDLILSLTEDFLHCPFGKYASLLMTALKQVSTVHLQGIERVVFLPLVEVSRSRRVKSASALLYLAQSGIAPRLVGFANPVAYERLTDLGANHGVRGPTLIVFLDDFVGTGESALRTLTRYRREFRKTSDRVVVVSLVAQERGVAAIQNAGFAASAAIVRKRGISDSTRLGDRAAALAVMDSLETRLGVDPEYQRGYHASEALVRMIRTPNNTFPVFWKASSADGTEWPAPFRR